MTISVEVKGMKELIDSLDKYPEQVNAALEATTEAAMLALWESVPPYPEPPANSSYRRTATLGRTLGSGVSGGKAGAPDIFEVHELGGGSFEGHFGTNLDYAPYVIGESEQAWMHKGRWWTIKTVAERAQEKIERLFNLLADKLAKYLDGK